MKHTIRVQTPVGVGQVWGIDRGKILVELDYKYLVEFNPGQVKHVLEECHACGGEIYPGEKV